MNTVYVKNRTEWRRWLRKNAARCQEIWLIYYKKDSGKPRIPYDDAVEEALCFGWIDGKAVKIDASCYAQRFTPRKPKSQWSPSNLERAGRMIAEGKMTPAGLDAFRPERRRELPVHPTALPKDLERRFKKDAAAWKNFQNFPPYYRRMTAGWVASAKKEETRLKRLAKLVEFSARNERIEFM